MNKKKEVYIPIEIKPREFVSQVYLAGELSKKGARVFIGSKSSMDQLIKEKEIIKEFTCIKEVVVVRRNLGQFHNKYLQSLY